MALPGVRVKVCGANALKDFHKLTFCTLPPWSSRNDLPLGFRAVGAPDCALIREHAMQDRRAVQRTRVRRNAKIIVNGRPSHGRSSLIHCTLHDLTSCGAQISVASTFRMPDTFELTFELGRTRRPCRVIWRTANRFGVAFEPFN